MSEQLLAFGDEHMAEFQTYNDSALKKVQFSSGYSIHLKEHEIEELRVLLLPALEDAPVDTTTPFEKEWNKAFYALNNLYCNTLIKVSEVDALLGNLKIMKDEMDKTVPLAVLESIVCDTATLKDIELKIVALVYPPTNNEEN